MLERTLAIREKALGSNYPNAVRVRKNYAALLEKMDVQPEELLTEALGATRGIGDEGY